MLISNIVSLNGTVTITVTGGSGNYLYTLNGTLEQTSNVFLNVPLGKHSINVRDRNTNVSTSKSFMLYVLEEVKDNDSFTVSYNPSSNKWISFHDYIANFFIPTLNKFYAVANSKLIYEHNTGNQGEFYGIIYPSYIDLAFSEQNQRLKFNTVSWYSDFVDDAQKTVYDKTFDAITIWNQHFTTSKLNLLTEDEKEVFDSRYATVRNMESYWLFNDLRNRGRLNKRLHKGILENFRTIRENLEVHTKVQGELLFPYCLVRLEYDNKTNYKFHLHEVGVGKEQSKI